MTDDAVSPTKSAPSLLQRLGPGLVTGAADDDPSGIATYSQAGAQFGYGLLWTVFLTHAVHDCDPARQRPDRPRHRQGAGGQRHADRAALGGAVARRHARCRQHLQHCRRHRRNGGGALAGDRRPQPRARADLRGGLDPAAGVPALSALFAGAEISHLGAVRLCRDRLYRQDPVEHGAARGGAAEDECQRRLFHDGRRRARHHDQPVSVLLAGLAGGRGDEPGPSATSRCAS
ncbi:hypothetical protein ACVWXL_004810 [Bradyrhizobium sp. GM22.5]